MSYQSVFARYESKYLLTREQYSRIVAAVAERMTPDSYGPTTIRNVYFDTPDYRLIRRSMEKPVYKENCASEATPLWRRAAKCSWN